MKNVAGRIVAIALLAMAVSFNAASAPAQEAKDTGTIEFVAQATPSGGRAESVMKLPVSLLRKSYAEIQKEAETTEPKPDLDKFIDGLDVSKELKAWMRRTRSVDLGAVDFGKRVTTKDLFEVPEFFEAFLARNAGDSTLGFPVNKARDRDRTENPEKYERAQKDYRERLRKFVVSNPHTRDGLEVQLASIDPGQRWATQESQRKQRIHDRALELAETTYLVTKTETDLEGRGAFVRVPSGDYWLSTVDAEATVGDARLRWDVPVPVRSGRVTRMTLSNVNAVKK